jgi:hypothetical protein
MKYYSIIALAACCFISSVYSSSSSSYLCTDKLVTSSISKPNKTKNIGFTFTVDSLFAEFDANSAEGLAAVFGEEDVDVFFNSLADKFYTRGKEYLHKLDCLICSVKKILPEFKDADLNVKTMAKIFRDPSNCRRRFLSSLSNISSQFFDRPIGYISTRVITSPVDVDGIEYKVKYVEFSPWSRVEINFPDSNFEPDALAMSLRTYGLPSSVGVFSSQKLLLSPAEASSTFFSDTINLCHLVGLSHECANTFLGVGSGLTRPGDDLHYLINKMIGHPSYLTFDDELKISGPMVSNRIRSSSVVFMKSLGNYSQASGESLLAFLPTVFGRRDDYGEFIMTGFAQGPMIKAENGQGSYMLMHHPFCSDSFTTFDATGVDFVWMRKNVCMDLSSPMRAEKIISIQVRFCYL